MFWIGLAFAFLLEWLGIVKLDDASLVWIMIAWGIFTGYMTFGALKISRIHLFIFASLTVLFFMLAAHFFGAIPALPAGIEGLFVGGAAVYGSAAVVLHSIHKHWVLPIGLVKKDVKIEYRPDSVEDSS
jgi:succinate-acetate transporter protein